MPSRRTNEVNGPGPLAFLSASTVRKLLLSAGVLALLVGLNNLAPVSASSGIKVPYQHQNGYQSNVYTRDIFPDGGFDDDDEEEKSNSVGAASTEQDTEASQASGETPREERQKLYGKPNGISSQRAASDIGPNVQNANSAATNEPETQSEANKDYKDFLATFDELDKSSYSNMDDYAKKNRNNLNGIYDTNQGDDDDDDDSYHMGSTRKESYQNYQDQVKKAVQSTTSNDNKVDKAHLYGNYYDPETDSNTATDSDTDTTKSSEKRDRYIRNDSNEDDDPLDMDGGPLVDDDLRFLAYRTVEDILSLHEQSAMNDDGLGPHSVQWHHRQLVDVTLPEGHAFVKKKAIPKTFHPSFHNPLADRFDELFISFDYDDSDVIKRKTAIPSHAKAEQYMYKRDDEVVDHTEMTPEHEQDAALDAVLEGTVHHELRDMMNFHSGMPDLDRLNDILNI